MRRAPRAASTSEKPPVEAPTSRQTRPATIELEVVERRRKLDPAARDIRVLGLRLDLGRRGNRVRGLADRNAIGGHQAGGDRGLRPRAAFIKTARRPTSGRRVRGRSYSLRSFREGGDPAHCTARRSAHMDSPLAPGMSGARAAARLAILPASPRRREGSGRALRTPWRRCPWCRARPWHTSRSACPDR